MNLTVKVKVPDGLKQLPGMLTDAMSVSIRESQGLLESSAKRNVAVRTGNLRRAISSEDPVVIGAKIIGITGARLAEAAYAGFVEKGTGVYHEPNAHGPWTIVPRNVKVLAWRSGAVMLDEKGKNLYINGHGGYTRTKHDAAMVFASKVTIQGMRARPYLASSLEQNRSRIEAIFRTSIKHVINQAGGIT